jgi:hypothetical protein
MVVHGRFDAVLTRPYACAYVGRKHRFSYRLSHEQVLTQLGTMIVHHAPMSGVFARAIGDYGYILRDPDEQRVIAACLAVQEKVAPKRGAKAAPREAISA